MIKVAAAGPISNLVLGFLGTFFFYLFHYLLMMNSNIEIFLRIFIQINIYLAIFNLIPIHPLDGGQIFGNLLSRYNPKIAQKLNYYGPRILMGVILIGIISGFSIIGIILEPLYKIISAFFKLIVKFFFSIFI